MKDSDHFNHHAMIDSGEDKVTTTPAGARNMKGPNVRADFFA